MTYPGAAANKVLQVVGAIYFFGSFLAGLFMLEDAQGFDATVDPFTIVLLVAQGVVVGVLLFALGAMGENLIGIREAVEGDPEGESEDPTDRRKEGAASSGPMGKN